MPLITQLPQPVSNLFSAFGTITPKQKGQALLAELEKRQGQCNIQKCLSLINRGADLEVRERGGKNPLICAAGMGYMKVVHALIEQGANLNTIAYDATGSAMHLAAMNGETKIVALLIEKGAYLFNDEVSFLWIGRRGHGHIVGMIKDAIAKGGPVRNGCIVSRHLPNGSTHGTVLNTVN